MVNPVRTLLNDLLGNFLILVGGTVLCFYTNWRLAVLAITSVCPISYAFRVYARYSQKMWRTIWQAYGDSNSVATEALGNMRTVKAFGTEKDEVSRKGFLKSYDSSFVNLEFYLGMSLSMGAANSLCFGIFSVLLRCGK